MLTGAEDLSRVPRKGRTVKSDEHKSSLSARYQQGGII
jgi:hypothetical protein